MKGRIRVITAGGTIDKDYLATEDNHGRNYEIAEPSWHAIAKRAKIPYAVTVREACRQDSLDMSDDDRDMVEAMTAAASEDKVVILHGTDTIHVTAERLSTIENKTIVLTGAMTPERFRDSDADFNVGMAIGAVFSLPPGIYIALYGEVVQWNEYIPR